MEEGLMMNWVNWLAWIGLGIMVLSILFPAVLYVIYLMEERKKRK